MLPVPFGTSVRQQDHWKYQVFKLNMISQCFKWPLYEYTVHVFMLCMFLLHSESNLKAVFQEKKSHTRAHQKCHDRL